MHALISSSWITFTIIYRDIYSLQAKLATAKMQQKTNDGPSLYLNLFYASEKNCLNTIKCYLWVDLNLYECPNIWREKKKIESELGCGVERGKNMQPNLNHAERKDGQFEKRTEDNKMSDYICSKRNSRRMNVGG